MADITQKNIQADKDGNWQAAIPNDFGPGQHTAVIQDATTGQKGVIVFQNPEKTYLINKVQKVVPEGFFYSILLLFLITVLLLMNYLVLVRKNRKNERRENIKKYLKNIRRTIILCLILLSLLFVIGVAFNKNTSWSNLLKTTTNKAQEKPFDVTGSIVDTLGGKGISGLDLSVGNVSIHTSEGGFFSFNSLNTGSEIRITSPLLKKALAKKVDGLDMKVLFDYDMYNKLVDIIDLESRGKISDIFEKDLSDSIKTKVNKENFIKNYESIFNDQNILDQKIVIGKIELIKDWVSKKYDIEQKDVVEIEVFNGSKSKVFNLHFNNMAWEIVT